MGANNDPAHALAVNYTTNALGQKIFKRDARLSSGADNPATTQQTVYAEDGIGSTVLDMWNQNSWHKKRQLDSRASTSECSEFQKAVHSNYICIALHAA
ncbi:hypothetical protein M5C99_12825 [Acidovorax sp. NCPPB 2350]|nr:hypothetical protein M5C99_12825 [Acidovorax sp. NCPPB 2350]